MQMCTIDQKQAVTTVLTFEGAGEFKMKETIVAY